MGTLRRFISSSYNERNFYTIYYQKNVFSPEMLSIAILAAENDELYRFPEYKVERLGRKTRRPLK